MPHGDRSRSARGKPSGIRTAEPAVLARSRILRGTENPCFGIGIPPQNRVSLFRKGSSALFQQIFQSGFQVGKAEDEARFLQPGGIGPLAFQDEGALFPEGPF